MNDKKSEAQGTPSRTHLFTVRIWRETAADGGTEIRGKVQHVLTGEVQFFRDWVIMEEFLAAELEKMEGGSAE